MTRGSFVFFHPTAESSKLFCEFSPPSEYLNLDIVQGTTYLKVECCCKKTALRRHGMTITDGISKTHKNTFRALK